MEYKDAKEAFVAGLGGTSVAEVQLVVSVALAAHLLWKAGRRRWETATQATAGSASAAASAAPPTAGGAGAVAVELVVLVLPVLVAFVAPQWAWAMIAVMGGIGAALVATEWMARPARPAGGPTTDERKVLASLVDGRKPFLEAYRAIMMLSTCIAILAVDFPIFPRRFAKTETWGTSLMDVGVGSFVLVNSLTAGNSLAASVPGAAGGLKHSPFRHALQAAVPLVVLGLGRLFSVKATDYQEHVSEYGVHWNFFFTLACLPLLSMLVMQCGVRQLPTFGTVGAIVALAYQAALSLTPLQAYVLDGPRDNLFSANKEGIVSVLGYFAIYAIGVRLGARLLQRKALAQWRETVVRLLVLDGVLWGLWLLCETVLGLQTSRRLANLPYVLWTLAYNLPFLAGLLAMDLWVGYTQRGALYQAINRNMLFVFLLANVLTGAVNFSMQTLYASDATAFAVLAGYIGTVCVVAAILHSLGITLKAW